MARVFQIIATDTNHPWFESAIINGDWHAAGLDSRTFCGIQLDGDDGIAAGDTIEGRVTCQLCRQVITLAKSIKNW